MGRQPIYAESAQLLGKRIAQRGFQLIYGGASIGLMAAVANGALDEGGEVFGVIPKNVFNHEKPHQQLTHLYEVDDLFERKAMMIALADAFIAIPGGYGTFDELFEVVTGLQLRLHQKPIGLFNVNDYFAPFLALVDSAVTNGFIAAGQARFFAVEKEVDALLDVLCS